MYNIIFTEKLPTADVLDRENNIRVLVKCLPVEEIETISFKIFLSTYQ